MSKEKRMVKLNGQWFDLSAVVHWWIEEYESKYYLKLIFEGNKDTFQIYIGNKEKSAQFKHFLESLIVAKYHTYPFEFKPPELPKPKETSSKRPMKKEKSKHYLEKAIPEE